VTQQTGEKISKRDFLPQKRSSRQINCRLFFAAEAKAVIYHYPGFLKNKKPLLEA